MFKRNYDRALPNRRETINRKLRVCNETRIEVERDEPNHVRDWITIIVCKMARSVYDSVRRRFVARFLSA